MFSNSIGKRGSTLSHSILDAFTQTSFLRFFSDFQVPIFKTRSPSPDKLDGQQA